MSDVKTGETGAAFGKRYGMRRSSCQPRSINYYCLRGSLFSFGEIQVARAGITALTGRLNLGSAQR